MIDRTQILLVVAVSIAGIAFWSTRQSANQRLFNSGRSDRIIERDDPVLDKQLTARIPEHSAANNLPDQFEHALQPLKATEANFSSLVLNSDKPVLVDFGAEWCGACRVLEPVIHELANELGGQAVVAQVDVDANRQLAQRYGIEALPTLLVFKNGQVVDKVVGVAPKEELRAKIDSQTDGNATLL